MNWGRFGFLTVGVMLIACAHGTPSQNGAQAQQSVSSEHGFDDHTIPSLKSEAQLNAYSFTRVGQRELKFIITDFSNPQKRALRFIDARFYQYHDEWYWFRLLNGQPVPGDDQAPFFGRKFSSPGEATAWGREQSGLPSRLSIVEDGRLYAPRFYKLALETLAPAYGLGSVFQLPAVASAGERAWAFELEYADKIDRKSVSAYFSLLKEAILPQMSENLVFVARSPQQYQFVELLRAQRHPLAASLRLSRELAEPGAVQVYQPGLTAGVLRIVESSELESFESQNSEILLLPLVPDYLPAAAGIVSAVPQTPLSHVNLLARNRGIPNVYLGRAAENRHFNQLARAEMPVVMLAEGQRLVIEALDARVYELWKRLTLPPWRQAPAVDVARLPYTRRLHASDFAHVDALRPAIGGKAAGALALLAGGVTAPPSPIALTVRSYFEHVAPVMPLVEAALVDPEFLKSPRVRFLALEGRARYDKHYFGSRDAKFADEFLKSRSKDGGPVVELIRQGGLTGWVRARRIRPATLEEVLKQLQENFTPQQAREGLRFRSSSTIEDIEGFNGAGLYDSNTGFFDAASRTSKKERKKTIEDAILRTWASYWGWEAFEERERARVDHLSGGMGVLIHPRFEDEKELANGVFSFTVDRRSSEAHFVYQMDLNVQRGAESVTNPDSGVTPEIVRMQGDHQGKVTHQVLARATGNDDESTVLSVSEMQQLFREAVSVAEAWLSQENDDLSPGQQRSSLTLDFEFRLMDPRWARSGMVPTGASPQLILKQVRSLEPALVTVSPELEKAPIPRELLGRAVRVEQMICVGQEFKLTALKLWTDPLASPDFGFGRRPFVASVDLRLKRDENVPVAGWFGGRQGSLAHDRFVDETSPTSRSDAQTLMLRLKNSSGAMSACLSLRKGEMVFEALGQPRLSEAMGCSGRVLLDDPDRLLREELDKITAR